MVLIMNFQTIGTYAWFLYHQDYIADVFCINKDKPALHCEGKCFLMERLAEQEPISTQDPEFPGAEERPVFLFYNGYESPNFLAKVLSCTDLPSYSSPWMGTDYTQGLFRPPKC